MKRTQSLELRRQQVGHTCRVTLPRDHRGVGARECRTQFTLDATDALRVRGESQLSTDTLVEKHRHRIGAGQACGITAQDEDCVEPS
jgi:hypothetical protein